MMTVLLRREIWDAIDSLLPRHMYYLALSLNRQTGNIFSLRRLRDIVHELSARHTGRHEHTSTSTFKLAHASFDRFRSPALSRKSTPCIRGSQARGSVSPISRWYYHERPPESRFPLSHKPVVRARWMVPVLGAPFLSRGSGLALDRRCTPAGFVESNPKVELYPPSSDRAAR